MNALQCSLLHETVVFLPRVFQLQYQGIAYRVWRVTGGYGASPVVAGSGLQCRSLLTGEETRFDGMAVERVATAADLVAVERAKVQR